MAPRPTSATWYSALGGRGAMRVWVRSSEGVRAHLAAMELGRQVCSCTTCEWPSGGAKLRWLLVTRGETNCLEVLWRSGTAFCYDNSARTGVVIFLVASVALDRGCLAFVFPRFANARRSGMKDRPSLTTDNSIGLTARRSTSRGAPS